MTWSGGKPGSEPPPPVTPPNPFLALKILSPGRVKTRDLKACPTCPNKRSGSDDICPQCAHKVLAEYIHASESRAGALERDNERLRRAFRTLREELGCSCSRGSTCTNCVAIRTARAHLDGVSRI